MATITAAMVKELREKTQAGMMDCKKALNECEGDLEAAVDYLRKKGLSAAAKKADRVASEGLVTAYSDENVGAIAEINSETDFVAKNEDFQQFAADVARIAALKAPADLEALLACDAGNGKTVQETLTAMIATIGENMNIRRFARVEGPNATYIHMGGKIGVVVSLDNGTPETAHDLCLHIAAANPRFLDRSSVDSDFVDKEREIFVAKAREQGKPDQIIDKIVTGQVNKMLKEVCLVDQPFVKDPDTTIGELLKQAGSSIRSYERFELGEGIEKKNVDFAEEVAQQVGATR